MDFSLMKDFMERLIALGVPDNSISVCFEGKEVFNYGKKYTDDMGSEYDSGGGGIVTTVNDYSKFCRALANGGTSPEGIRILSKGTVDLMRTNQLSPELLKDFNRSQLKGYSYGLGVRTMTDKAASGSTCSLGEFG